MIRRAIPKSFGARSRTRSDPGGRTGSGFQGERSWTVITEGVSGKYGTAKSVPWKTSIERLLISHGRPALHHLPKNLGPPAGVATTLGRSKSRGSM